MNYVCVVLALGKMELVEPWLWRGPWQEGM